MESNSKGPLAKIVLAAKRHWWLFVPVIIIIALGYALFSIIDCLHILFLRLLNVFLAIYSAIRNCMHRFAQFISKGFTNARLASKARHTAFSAKMSEMSENAHTARDQLLNGAVAFCTDRHLRRASKKAELREQARAMLAPPSPSIELSGAAIITATHEEPLTLGKIL